MVSENVVKMLNKGFGNYLFQLLTKAGYVEPKVWVDEEGVGHDVYGKIPVSIEFYLIPGPKLRVRVTRESINGIEEKARGEGERLGEYVKRELDKVKSNPEMRNEHGYLEGRAIYYGKKTITLDCRVKRVPEETNFNDLFNSIWGILLKPLLKLDY